MDIRFTSTTRCIAVGVLSGYCPVNRLRAAGAQPIITDYEGMDVVTARTLFGSYVRP
ncbi:hypothetical protein NFC73_06290 [Pseudarthrobacter sp. RMG13]|uniref:Uncharacterized protein n=1 Tax=Pseudarthrobacter humi TaxID=2952523 RepID=A0ABT1LLM4_9MICC|nr:hypothetical protein [Pseudarthrobacter humi]MCP8999349.1 hypothetical protein [Pseudarthrobacter humi]